MIRKAISISHHVITTHVAGKVLVYLIIILICIRFPEASKAQTSGSQEKTKLYKLEEIVVSATRTETAYKEIASSITIITAEEIESKQVTLLLDVLRTVPALDVVQLGGPGGQTSIFMRGAHSNHTLVLIDGVEANDPISPGRAFDFATLTTENIERIEILRGPQSTLYGSDAVAGIINIITKKGSGKPKISLMSDVGTFGTFKSSLELIGGYERLDYSFSLSRFDTDGISSAKESLGNTEKDGYSSTSLSTRIGFSVYENSGIDVIVRYLDSKSDIDNGGGAGLDDPNNFLETEQLYLRLQARLISLGNLWELKLGGSYSDLKRVNDNGVDPGHPESMFLSTADGTVSKFDLQNNIYIGEHNTITFGIETENETGSSERTGDFPSIFNEKSERLTGYYAQDQLDIGDSFFATAGIRVDKHDRFGTHTTFRFAPALFLNKTGTKLKATYGTGFRAPSLFQLYSAFGSENLMPDESEGWDIGFEQYFLDTKLSFGVTYYKNDFKNLIDFDLGTFKYNNIGAAETKGVEVFANLADINNFTISGNYTFTDTEDKNTGESFIRRPKHKFGLDVYYRLSGKANVNFNLSAVGERDDNDFSTFPSKRVKLDSYVLANIAVMYSLTGRIQLAGSVKNLFDSDYENALGFGTYGISVNGGLRFHY